MAPKAISMQLFAVSNVSLDSPNNPIPGIRTSVNSQKVSKLRATSMREGRKIQSAREGRPKYIRAQEARLHITPPRENRSVDGVRDA